MAYTTIVHNRPSHPEMDAMHHALGARVNNSTQNRNNSTQNIQKQAQARRASSKFVRPVFSAYACARVVSHSCVVMRFIHAGAPSHALDSGASARDRPPRAQSGPRGDRGVTRGAAAGGGL